MSCVFSLCIFNNAKMKLLARLLQNYFCVLFTASHLGYTMSTCPTTGDVNLDHLVKMIYSVFLHFRVTFFPFQQSCILEQILSAYANVLFSNFCPLILTPNCGSCLHQLLRLWSVHLGSFVFLLFLAHLLIGLL